MNFINKEAPVIPASVAESISQRSDNDFQALILANITSDIIRASVFARDENDEVYALVVYYDEADWATIYSREFETSIYWFGRLKGVSLDAGDIEIIIDNLRYYVVVSDNYDEFIVKHDEALEAC